MTPTPRSDTPTSPSDDPLFKFTPRGLRYLAAILTVVVGILCGAIIPGTLGGTICTGIVGIGLVAVISMVFYDVGLSEDRDRERERERESAATPARREQRDAGFRSRPRAGAPVPPQAAPSAGAARRWPKRRRDSH